MKNIFLVANIVLALIVVILLTIATRTWIAPKYPDKVDLDSLTYVPNTFEPLVLNRKVKNAKIINATVTKGAAVGQDATIMNGAVVKEGK